MALCIECSPAVCLVHDSIARELFLFKVSCVLVAPPLDLSLFLEFCLVCPPWMYLYWLCSRSAFAPSLFQLWCALVWVCFCNWYSSVLNLLLLRVCSCTGCAQLLHQKWSFSGCGRALSSRFCSCSRRDSVPCVLLPWSVTVQWSGCAVLLLWLWYYAMCSLWLVYPSLESSFGGGGASLRVLLWGWSCDVYFSLVLLS